MAQQAGYSPSFKLPTDIMRMRRKRARSGSSGSTESPPGQSGSSVSGTRPFSPGPLFKEQSPSRPGLKRRNPFATIENTYSPQKKLLIYDEDGGHPFKTEWTHKDGNEDTTVKEQDRSACSDSLMEVRRIIWTKYVIFLVKTLHLVSQSH